MKVILKSVSHPRVGDIDIVDDLFAIGRNEEPFASKLGEAAASLSRRHARVFQENGEIFVADLGSRNGTRVNERELEHNVATALNNNDLLTFGEAVEFQVEIQPAAEQTADIIPPICLTLVPTDPALGLDTVAIESFPFLIARNEGEFEHYRERLPAAWRRMSRRHALIALKGGRVNVEDLGSSNGTHVSGVKLDELARELSNGDIIAFGDPVFSYTVQIEKSHEPTLLHEPEQPDALEASAPVDEPAGASHTRFVTSADSFINVFCADDELVEGTGAARTLQIEQLKVPATGLRRLRTMAGQLWRALGGGNSVDRRFVWGAAGVLGVIATAAVITYLVGVDRREIKELLDDGQYSESARAANNYLEHNQDDREATAWAEQALIRSIVPTWLNFMAHGRFAEAAQFLTVQRETHLAIPRGLQMIDTLAWAGKVEAHMADRAGVPVSNGLASLRSDNALYVKAIDELKASVAAALKRDDRQTVGKLISEFRSRYPRVIGDEALREDSQWLPSTTDQSKD